MTFGHVFLRHFSSVHTNLTKICNYFHFLYISTLLQVNKMNNIAQGIQIAPYNKALLIIVEQIYPEVSQGSVLLEEMG